MTTKGKSASARSCPERLLLLSAFALFVLSIFLPLSKSLRWVTGEPAAALVYTSVDPVLQSDEDYIEARRTKRMSGLRQAELGSLGTPAYVCPDNKGEFCIIDNICVDLSRKKKETWFTGRPLSRKQHIQFVVTNRGRERYRINATHIDDPARRVHVIDDNVHLFNPMHNNRYYLWIRAFALWNTTRQWSPRQPYHVLYLGRAGYRSRSSLEMLEPMTYRRRPLLFFTDSLKDYRVVCFRRLIAQYPPQPTMLLYSPLQRYDDVWSDPHFASLAQYDKTLRALIPRFRKHMLRSLGVERVAMETGRVLLVTREVGRNGGAAYRRIVNEMEIMETMQAAGLVVDRVDFAQLGHVEQVLRTRRASIFVAMHGAGMANMVWLHPGAVVVELHPYGFQKWGYERLARYLRQPYVTWVNMHPENSIRNQASDQYTSVDENFDYYRHRDQVVDVTEFQATLAQALEMARIVAGNGTDKRT